MSLPVRTPYTYHAHDDFFYILLRSNAKTKPKYSKVQATHSSVSASLHPLAYVIIWTTPKPDSESSQSMLCSYSDYVHALADETTTHRLSWRVHRSKS